MHIKSLFVSLVLAATLLAGARVSAAAPEQEAVVDRYDAERQVLVIAGREYRLSGEVANQLMRYAAAHGGAEALDGKQIAYSARRNSGGQLVIEAIAY